MKLSLKNIPLPNKYFIIGFLFIIWMIFFDQNSYLLQNQLSNEIEKTKNDIAYYKENIKKEKQELDSLKNTPEIYERIAREKYLMKKSDETIFLIQPKQDSIDDE